MIFQNRKELRNFEKSSNSMPTIFFLTEFGYPILHFSRDLLKSKLFDDEIFLILFLIYLFVVMFLRTMAEFFLASNVNSNYGLIALWTTYRVVKII